TITTVGYGDFFPVTFLGRATAVLVMFAGVGIIGSLASILASILVPSADETAAAAAASEAGGEEAPSGERAAAVDSIQSERAQIRIELAAMLTLLAERS